MKKATLRNFHVPLPEDLYSKLRSESERSKIPATAMVRHAIENWLHQREKAALKEAIANYAVQHAGTAVDLDQDIEAASIEYLLAEKEGIL